MKTSSKTVISGIGMILGITMTISHGRDFITGIKETATETKESKKNKKKNKKKNNGK